MKTIYTAIIERLQPMLDDATLKWIDLDKGQLKKSTNKNRPDVNYPCALIRIGVTSTKDVTDYIQDCNAAVTVTLAFNIESSRTSADAPAAIRAENLEPYDIIAEVYALLQGYSSDSFNPMRRRSQSEVSHPDLFVYQIAFNLEFRDSAAVE